MTGKVESPEDGTAAMPGSTAELGRALGVSSASRAIAMIVSLAIGAVTARALTTSEFAFFGVLISFSTVFVIFLQLGYQTGITKIAGEASHGGDRSAVGAAIWAGTAAILLLALLSLPLLANFAGEFLPRVNGAQPSNTVIGMVVIYCVALALCIMFAEAIRGLGHIGWAASLTGMGQNGGIVRGGIILAAAGVLALISSLDLVVMLIIASLASLVAAIISLMKIARSEDLAIRPAKIAREFKGHLGTNLRLMAGQLLQVLASQNAMLIVAGAILSGAPLAMVVAAQQVRNVLTSPMTLFNGAAPKLIIHAHRDGDKAELERLVRLGASLATIIVILVAPAFLLFGRLIFSLIFGTGFGDAAFYFSLLIPGLLAFAMGGSAGRLMVLCGRERAFMYYSLAMAAISIPALVWAASTHGAVGISIATSAILLVQNVILVVLVRRYFQIWPHAYLAPRHYVALGRSLSARLRRRRNPGRP